MLLKGGKICNAFSLSSSRRPLYQKNARLLLENGLNGIDLRIITSFFNRLKDITALYDTFTLLLVFYFRFYRNIVDDCLN